MDLLSALMTVTLVHLLAAASPGPDFVMVSQQSLTQGRRAGVLCSLGIALGLSVHIIYSSLGLAAMVSHSVEILTVLKYLAAAYLIWLGVKGLRSRAAEPGVDVSPSVQPRSESRLIAMGFVCNALNPKAPLYFMSLFTLVISPESPLWQIVVLGGWMMLLQFGWFSLVAFLLSRPSVRQKVQRVAHWIDRSLGAVMVAFGVGLLFSEVKR
ncbi:LysE family translocator [Marinobacterium marinum]|uniref:LysE family transporter n=1 Tax=Marinobacterium marinum TaxID=2756129 RepID=A0A7W1WYV8_9GAMM|nr:LysE family transporter [Marinobacterium marinum]MBA4502673.1 LysE family transporter [Marinobacterium marinum]